MRVRADQLRQEGRADTMPAMLRFHCKREFRRCVRFVGSAYATKRRQLLIRLSCRALQIRYPLRDPSLRRNGRTPAAAGSPVKVGGYQRRTVLGKPSPGGSARRWREAVESRIPCVSAACIVVDNAQKRQPDVWHGMESFMPIRLNLVPEFRPCIHACERLACSRGSRLCSRHA